MDNLLIIRYPCGRLTISLNTFFPAPYKKSQQLFRLMKKNSSGDDIRNLLTYLQKQAGNPFAKTVRRAERYQKNADLLLKITGVEIPKDDDTYDPPLGD